MFQFKIHSIVKIIFQKTNKFFFYKNEQLKISIYHSNCLTILYY